MNHCHHVKMKHLKLALIQNIINMILMSKDSYMENIKLNNGLGTMRKRKREAIL